MAKKKEDPVAGIVGGATVLGVGVGFFLLHISALAFVGSILAGVGLGLLLSSLISYKK